MKYLEGTPLSVEQSKTLGIHLRPNDRLPKILGDSISVKIVQGHTESIRLILTILMASRALTLGTDLDLSTIEEPRKDGCQSFDALVSSMDRYSRQF